MQLLALAEAESTVEMLGRRNRIERLENRKRWKWFLVVVGSPTERFVAAGTATDIGQVNGRQLMVCMHFEGLEHMRLLEKRLRLSNCSTRAAPGW